MSEARANIILETFCTFRSMNQKKTVKNKDYIPKTRRPKWCRSKNKGRVPEYRCLKSNCPFFAYTDAGRKEYMLFKEIRKEVDKDE